MCLATSLARKTQVAAWSSGSARRPNGMPRHCSMLPWIIPSRRNGSPAARLSISIEVAVEPGQSEFTVMLYRASSRLQSRCSILPCGHQLGNEAGHRVRQGDIDMRAVTYTGRQQTLGASWQLRQTTVASAAAIASAVKKPMPWETPAPMISAIRSRRGAPSSLIIRPPFS
jgi:hypothetical protein